MQHHPLSIDRAKTSDTNRRASVSRSRPPQRSARRLALLLIALIVTSLVLPTRASSAFAGDLAQPISSGMGAGSAQAAAQASTAPLALSPTFLLNGEVGTAYLQVMTASGGAAPYAFAITFGDPVPGLALSAEGVLSGTPTTAGAYGFFITVTDAHGSSVSQFYNLTIITPIAISPPTLPEGKAGTAYRQSFAASGGTAPYTFTLTTGALPPGLALSPAGLFNGTPTADGFYSFTVGATDAHGISGSQSYGLFIAQEFAINPALLPNGTVGTSYSQNLTGSGGTAPYSFAVSDGALPPGLTLSAAGLLSGTPSAPGSFFFTVSATDARGFTSRQFYALAIIQVSLAISPSSLPDGKVGVAYRQRLSGSGGTAPYSFAVSDGALPPGLTLASDGRLSGVPTAEGFFFVGIVATDARGRTGGMSYSLLIAQTPLAISPTSLPGGTVGVAYRQRLTASGGSAPYAFAVQGALPPGLALRSDGRIIGRPTTAGAFFFGISVTDASGRIGGQFYAITIAQALFLSPSFFPNGQAGTPYLQTVTATGGRAPYTFAVSDGALPPGLTLSTAGALSGRPTTPGFFGFAITATDSRGVTGSQFYSLTVLTPIAVSPPALLDGRVGTTYQQSIAASGGAAPYSFAVSDGALPPGLTLSTAGLLSGTPTTDGFYNFAISATDTRGILGHQSYSLLIAQALDISPLFLQPGILGEAYAATLIASAATAPFTFTVTIGMLPPGLALSTAGILNGTPSAAGWFSFEVTATDARGLTGRHFYHVAIDQPQITISPEVLPEGQVGKPYQQQLVANGGIGPYIFFADFLPPGLILRPDGLLYGVPASGWESPISITALDSRGFRAGAVFPLFIAPIAIHPAFLPNAVVGIMYTQQLTTSGGTAPFTFVVNSGALPEGLTLSRDGIVSGMPAVESAFFVQVRVLDANGFAGIQNYEFSVVKPLELSSAALPEGTVGTPYSAALSASGGAPPYNFTLTHGALPPGLALNDSGSISGTPTIAGVYTFTATVTDLGGRTASQTYTVVVS